MGTTDWLQLRDRACLIAGAGGIGGECALLLAQQGVNVVLVDIDGSNLANAQQRITSAGADVETIIADLSDADVCRQVVAEAHDRLGRLDIFVHAIGRNIRLPVLELADGDWEAIIRLNLSTGYWLGQAVGRIMCSQRHGRLVFVSSVSGLLAHADHAPYAATKGGLNQLLRVMAREWAPHNVMVNAVAPGYTETDLTRAYLDSAGHREELTRLVPAGRLGSTTDVGDAIVFLASDRARFITGQVLYVDGGRVLV